MPNAIDINQLTKDYTGEKALRGISFHVPSPCLFGVIGADGAGKSTLMNILATLLDANSGQAKLLGQDLMQDFGSLRGEIGYMPQRFSLYQDLTVQENLHFFADIFGIKGSEKAQRMAQLLHFANLNDFKERRAGLLSGGMKQKLALACTLIHAPNLLLLDEPTVGVDPVARQDFWAMLKSLRKEGKTLVVSTPYMDEAELCDELILLHEGEILAHGTPTELIGKYPHRLYRIVAKEATLTYAGYKRVPPGFALIYPSGGALHAAAIIAPPNGSTLNNSEVLTRIRTVIPDALSVESMVPTLEDLLFALLHNKSGMNRGNENPVKL